MTIVYEFCFGAVLECMKHSDHGAIAQREGWPLSRWIRLVDIEPVGRLFFVLDTEHGTAEHWSPSAADLLCEEWAIMEEQEGPSLELVK